MIKQCYDETKVRSSKHKMCKRRIANISDMLFMGDDDDVLATEVCRCVYCVRFYRGRIHYMNILIKSGMT